MNRKYPATAKVVMTKKPTSLLVNIPRYPYPARAELETSKSP